MPFVEGQDIYHVPSITKYPIVPEYPIDHQIIHQKSLEHKESYEKYDSNSSQESMEQIMNLLFKEYELTIDLEENDTKNSDKFKNESSSIDY